MRLRLPNNKIYAGIDLVIVLTAVILCLIVVKKYFPGAKPTLLSAPAVGAKILLPGVDWSSGRETMLLVLRADCHFCTESAPFYRRLVDKVSGHPNFQLIAVMPQTPADARKYLDSVNVSISDVKQSTLPGVSISGTPTLLLLDDRGVVTAAWAGLLSRDQENRILSRIDSLVQQ